MAPASPRPMLRLAWMLPTLSAPPPTPGARTARPCS